MKGILVLILAAAVGYVAYKYAYPPLAEAMKFEKHKPKSQEVAAAPAPKVEPVVEAPKPVMEEPPKPEPPPPPMVVAAPEPMPAPAPMPEPPKADADGFVPPTFLPLEEVTKNWTVIPAGAFKPAKQVMMKRDLELKMKVGNGTSATKIKAGGLIFAVGQEGTNLIVAPTETSPMKGQVAMDDTNFKDVLSQAYETLKTTQTENARRAHAYRLAAAERAKSAPPSSSGGGSKGSSGGGGGKPAKDADGTYPLLVASMKSGQVTEIKMDNIKEWGEPELKEGVWLVNVKYETQTPFGKFDTEAQAQIKDGKVDKWVYTGSGEVVP